MSTRFVTALLTIWLISGPCRAQTDTVAAPPKVYNDIEKFSHKGKVSRFFYKLFFKPVNVSKSQVRRHEKRKDLQRPYAKAEGKIVRDIYIQTLDPFGCSIGDTCVRAEGFWAKAGNGTHVKTQRLAILNLLLFRKYEPFDSLLVLESERLIRQQEYVHEVQFTTLLAGTDSVDVLIRELDSWSLVPRISGSPSGFKADVTEKNFMGFGHRFQNIFTRDFSEGNDFSTIYTIPTIRNTYIHASLAYSRDRFDNTLRGASLERPFFSSYAQWAGGVSVATQYRNDSLRLGTQEYNPINYRFRTLDAWGGFAHRIIHGNTQDARVTRLVYTLRYVQTRYIDRPVIPDSIHLYTNDNLYLAGVGLTSPKFQTEKYVFKFGVTEDIPIGRVFALTGGYQERSAGDRTYFGVRCGYGNFTNIGYLSAQASWGSFFRSGNAEEGLFAATLVYFTDLADVGSWKFRQFIRPELLVGLGRAPGEELQFQRSNGMGGFTSMLTGDKRFVLTLQTQSYAPWKVLGFQFGPYFIYSMGMLADAGQGFGRSRVYHQLSLGVLLRNDYLVFNNIQFSFSFFPLVPGTGDDIVKINARTTTDFMLRDFNMDKPGLVVFE